MNLNTTTTTKSFNSGITLANFDFVSFCFENFKKTDFDKLMRHLVGVKRNDKLFFKANFKLFKRTINAIL